MVEYLLVELCIIISFKSNIFSLLFSINGNMRMFLTFIQSFILALMILWVPMPNHDVTTNIEIAKRVQ